MKDILLWRLLQEDELDAERIASELDAFPLHPHEARIPYFALLSRCVEHPSARLRAAAYRLLWKIEGLPGVRWLHRGLDDPDADVAIAAARSMHCERQFHVAFHERAVIRRIYVEHSLSCASRHPLVHLLGDPDLKKTIIDNAPWREFVRSESWPFIEQMAVDGLLSAADVIALFRHDHDELVRPLEAWAGLLHDPTDDHVDVTPSVATERKIELLFEILEQERRLWILGVPVLRASHLLNESVHRHRALGVWHVECLAAAATRDLSLLLDGSIPIALRREALRIAGKHPSLRWEPDLIERGCADPLCRTDSGAIDLELLLALFGSERGTSLAEIDKRFREEIPTGLVEAPAAVRLLVLEKERAIVTSWLAAVADREDGDAAFILASTCMPDCWPEVLQGMPAPRIRELLLRMASDPDMERPPDTWDRWSNALGARCEQEPDVRRAFVEAVSATWSTRPDGGEAASILSSLAGSIPLDLIAEAAAQLDAATLAPLLELLLSGESLFQVVSETLILGIAEQTESRPESERSLAAQALDSVLSRTPAHAPQPAESSPAPPAVDPGEILTLDGEAFEVALLSMLPFLNRASEPLSHAIPDGFTFAGVLARALSLDSPAKRIAVWRSMEWLLSTRRHRGPWFLPAPRESIERLLLDVMVFEEFAETGNADDARWAPNGASERLEMRRIAARMLRCLAGNDRETRARIETVLIPRLGSFEHEILLELAFLDVSGLGLMRAAPVEPEDSGQEEAIDNTASTDLLIRACLSGGWRQAERALGRLLRGDREGVRTLFRAIFGEPTPLHARKLLDAMPDSIFEEEAGLLLELLSSSAPKPRFVAALRLHCTGAPAWNHVIGAVNAETREAWMRESDWKKLTEAAPSMPELCRAVCVSPHPTVYIPAVSYLLDHDPASSRDALVRFLEVDHERLGSLRVRVAETLAATLGDATGITLLVSQALGEEEYSHGVTALNRSLQLCTRKQQLVLVESIHASGKDDLLLGSDAGEDVVPAVLRDGRRFHRYAALRRLRVDGPGRNATVSALARVGAWAVDVGRELTGRTFRLTLFGADDEIGMTNVRGREIHFNPLPMLTGERDGRTIVKAILLHEIGHHKCNSAREWDAVGRRAHEDGIPHLLNLVQDEHLERNLRALDEEWGNALKTLAAWAFQHSQREIPIDDLFDALGAKAFRTLTACRLEPAREPDHVRVDSGALLLQLSRAGSSFARFMRALRMNLGNREDDPKVEEALALFKGRSFRSASPERMLEIAAELARIFASEAGAASTLSLHAALAAAEDPTAPEIAGITDEQLAEAIEAELAGKDGDSDPGPPVRAVNLLPDVDFEPIAAVEKVSYDPLQLAELVRPVSAWAARLRRFFLRMGVSIEPRKKRISGVRLDRGAIVRASLTGDPRIVISRKVVYASDLFLGVIIDCSGSMAINERIELAKRFAALIADATRSVRGIDARFFGFTDAVIFDAGNAERCAVAALEAGGGNNDAAALWHAAHLAQASRRSARLLIMISDGSPTECTVDALRALVERLTNRMNIVCAQVAVCEIDHDCFRNSVLIEDQEPGEAVRKFGSMVVRLVRKALASR